MLAVALEGWGGGGILSGSRVVMLRLISIVVYGVFKLDGIPSAESGREDERRWMGLSE